MFKYEPVNNEFYQKELNRQENGDPNFFFLKKGLSQVRILPPAPGSNGRWIIPVKDHFLKLADGSSTSVNCPETAGEPCPICLKGRSDYNQGQNDNDLELIEKARSLRPSTHFLSNVLVFACPNPDEAGPDKGVKIMKCGVSVKRELLNYDQDVAGGWGDITNVSNGITFRIERTGERLSTRYSVKPIPKRTDLEKDLAAHSVDINNLKLHNLDNSIQFKTYEELEEVLAKVEHVPDFTEGLEDKPLTEPVVIEAETPEAVDASEDALKKFLAGKDPEELAALLSNIDKPEED